MPLASEPIRVLIADDHALIREGFKNLLSHLSEIELVAFAANGKEAVELTQKENPQVILMDIRMPVMSGIEACLRIRQLDPQIKVIAFSMFDDEQSILQMRMAGARGYLLKNTDSGEICKAVKAVHEGGEYYSDPIRNSINHLFRNGRLSPSVYERKQDYSEIELKIIRLLCQEMTSKEIADVLQLNRRTIEHHKERIQEKMGVQTSVGIAVYALTHWLLNE